jgi:uncharacterized protein (TIGR03083 family)
MALPREDVASGTMQELAGFEDLLRAIDEDQATAPTRCDGWTVADVAAHVTGTSADIANGRLAELAGPNASSRQVAERKGVSLSDVADELHQSVKVCQDLVVTFDDAAWAGPAPAGITGTLGQGVEAIWYDAYLHGDDIRAALGLPSERGPGLRASVSHLADMLTNREWGPATLAFDGLEPFPVSGGGDEITGDALAFVLVATGRADPATLGLDPSVNIYG